MRERWGIEKKKETEERKYKYEGGGGNGKHWWFLRECTGVAEVHMIQTHCLYI